MHLPHLEVCHCFQVLLKHTHEGKAVLENCYLKKETFLVIMRTLWVHLFNEYYTCLYLCIFDRYKNENVVFAVNWLLFRNYKVHLSQKICLKLKLCFCEKFYYSMHRIFLIVYHFREYLLDRANCAVPIVSNVFEIGKEAFVENCKIKIYRV